MQKESNIVLWIYTLHGYKIEFDWQTDRDVKIPCVLSTAVVNDPSDNICLYGRTTDGKHVQFDSYEAYHADEYFNEKTTGEMRVTSKKFSIPVSVLEKYLIAE